MNRAVFLDRDGVINRAVVRAGKPYPPATFAEFELLPGAAGAMRALRAAGLRIVVATNQPDIGTGTQKPEVVRQMHDSLLAAGLCDDIRMCTHVDADGCDCRKPRPGMLTAAARELDIDLAGSFLVGDRWRDIDAGNAVGCRSYFIDYGYREQRPAAPFTTVQSLVEAGTLILQALRN